VPKETKEEIARVTQNLQKKNFPVVWQDPEKAHITLIFLGHIAQERFEAAVSAVKKVAELQSPFELSTGQLDYFYSSTENSDSVILVGIQDPDRTLRNLYKELRNALGEEEFSPPTRLHPHITIGRLKKQKDRKHQTEMLLSLVEEPVEGKTITVKSIGVMESIPDRGATIAGETTKTRNRLLNDIPLRKNG